MPRASCAIAYLHNNGDARMQPATIVMVFLQAGIWYGSTRATQAFSDAMSRLDIF